MANPVNAMRRTDLTHAGHAHDLDHATQSANAQMITVRGHAVCQPGVQAGGASPAAQDCTFETGDGKRYPLVRAVTSRALFEDADLRAKDLEVTGQLDRAGRLEVIQTRSVKNGVPHDVYYWCETCHIRSPYGGDCWCCFQPFEFREEAIQKLLVSLCD